MITPATCLRGHELSEANTRWYWSQAKCRSIRKCLRCCRERPFSMRRFVEKVRTEK